jgi:hypothetical protein
VKRPTPKLSESELQKAVIGRAQALGWKAMHPLPGKVDRGRGYATSTSGDGKGYPDLTLVRERFVWVELKAEGKYLTVEQKLWRDWIIAAGGEWYLWRPLQWFDGTVDVVLGVVLKEIEVVIPEEDERWARLVFACGGDVEQARKIYATLERGTAPPQ